MSECEQLTTYVRWLLNRDLRRVLGIERASFESPWSRSRFVELMEDAWSKCYVAEVEDHVVGFVIGTVRKSHLRILNVAVDPEYRREGVGTALVHKLVDAAIRIRRNRLTMVVHERNLDGQLFLRELGFEASRIMHNHCADGCDAYRMVRPLVSNMPRTLARE